MIKTSKIFISLMALFFTFNIGSAFAYTEFSDYTVNYETSGPWGAGYYLNCPSNLGDGERYVKNGNNFPLTSLSGWDLFNTGTSYCNNANWGAKGVQLNAIGFYCDVGTPSDIVFINTGNSNYAMIHCDASGEMWKSSDFNYVPPDTTTRIISVSPENNVNIVPFTQSSTTKYAPFDIDLLEYYNNESTSTIAYFTTILTNRDIPAFTYTKVISDIATGTATTSYSIYNEVPFGLYDYTIRLFDSNLDLIDATTSTNIQFGSTTLPSITFEDLYGATSTRVFTATEQSVVSYINLVNLLKTKAPFGYFYIVKDSLSNINTTSTSTVNIIIPAHLKTYFFTPFDLAFSGILWFYFIVFFYKRIKHITI